MNAVTGLNRVHRYMRRRCSMNERSPRLPGAAPRRGRHVWGRVNTGPERLGGCGSLGLLDPIEFIIFRRFRQTGVHLVALFFRFPARPHSVTRVISLRRRRTAAARRLSRDKHARRPRRDNEAGCFWMRGLIDSEQTVM